MAIIFWLLVLQSIHIHALCYAIPEENTDEASTSWMGPGAGLSNSSSAVTIVSPHLPATLNYSILGSAVKGS